MNLWLMENTGTSPLLRSRRLGSFLSTSSGPGVRGTPKIPVKKVGQTLRHDVCVGGDGWGSTLISCVRMATCFITVMVLTVIWAVIMVVLIPWPYERIKQGNVYGHVTGRLMVSSPSSCDSCQARCTYDVESRVHLITSFFVEDGFVAVIFAIKI
ncbi:unnamed protein product [Malus baccata var. baccata]